MTEVTAGATTAKTAKHTASLPKDRIPKSDLPNMEMPEAFREFAEKGVAQVKDTYEKAKAATEEATDLLKNAYTTAAKGATDYNLKVLEIARTNTNTAFDYAHELLGVKSLSEFVERSTAHASKQFEAMTAQTKELTELAHMVMTEIAEPLKTGVTKAFNKVA
jgi:phasin